MHPSSILSKAVLALPFIGLFASASPVIDAHAPTASQVMFRVEGADGTIFEGMVYHPGPCTVTTASGGTHVCNGQNNGANPNPGPNPTCAIKQAGTHVTNRPTFGPFEPFGFDGEYDSQFDDYFITTIGNTTQTANDFWGILVNYQFTPTGGCQYETSLNDEVLWAFNAFNVQYFLKLTGPATPVIVNQPFTVNVIDGMSGNPIEGATVGDTTTDSDGNAEITFTTTGKQLLKAFADNAIRSNYIAVHVKKASD